MVVNLKSTKSLIKKVLEDIDKFNNKTPGEPVWKYLHEIEYDKNMPEAIVDFAANFSSPPSDGTAQKYIDYYTNALKEIKKAGIDPEIVSFGVDDEYMTVGMTVTPINNMTNSEYYKEVVFNKGQLISFQKENARNLEKTTKVHEDYMKDLDADTKTKLNAVHAEKIKPFKEIEELLSDAVAKITEEELKYKPAKTLKR
jgi:hypothetical protein